MTLSEEPRYWPLRENSVQPPLAPPESLSELALLEGPRIRAVPARGGLVPQIQACLEGAPDYFTRTEGRLPAPDAAERLVADAEADEARRVYALVPITGGAAVGVVDLFLHHPEPGVAHVALLLFRESCQGLGYGRETAAALEGALARSGFAAVRASVADENAEARAFWERIGYAEVGRLERSVSVYEKRIR